MDNKRIPEDKQLEHPTPSEVNGQDELVQDRSAELSPEHSALSETSEQSNFLQNGLNWLQINMNPGHLNWVRQSPREALDLIYKLKHKKESLESSNERLVQNNEILIRENTRLKQDNQNLNHNSKHYSQKYNQQSQANYQIREENETLRRNNAVLKEEIKQSKKEGDELDTRFNALLSELAAYRRDPTTTYISDDSRSQNHLLVQEFKELKEQDSQRISSSIFSHRCESIPSLKADRKQEIARIKAILSEEIMVKGMTLSTEESASTHVMDSVCTALGMSAESSIPEALRTDIGNLVKKGLELMKKIASADPPGVLWTEKEGTPFNPDRHEAMLGCEEGGKILLTVYPGYLVGDRVFEKALVLTVPEAETRSTDDQSEHQDEIESTQPLQ